MNTASIQRQTPIPFHTSPSNFTFPPQFSPPTSEFGAGFRSKRVATNHYSPCDAGPPDVIYWYKPQRGVRELLLTQRVLPSPHMDELVRDRFCRLCRRAILLGEIERRHCRRENGPTTIYTSFGGFGPPFSYLRSQKSSLTCLLPPIIRDSGGYGI